MKRAQAWSMDIMIAIVVFIGVIFVFYSIISGKQESKAKDLQDDALMVLENIASEDSGMAIIDGVNINETKLKELLGENYSQLKSKLRIRSEFCIFFEDENGNIIYISQNQTGIGSEKITISDVPCG